MKTINILILCLIMGKTFPQEAAEKDISTEVNEVTVFIQNAQVTRKKTVDLTAGTTILKFVKLSPFIDAKSIQVKAEGEITVMSVNHQQNFMDKLKKSQELTGLETQLEGIGDKIKIENTCLEIMKEELLFLQENRDIGTQIFG